MGKKKVILAVFDFLQLAHDKYSDLSDKQCSNDYKELNTQFDAKWREIVDESCPEAVTVTNGNILTDDYSLCDSSYPFKLLRACTALGGDLQSGFDDLTVNCPLEVAQVYGFSSATTNSLYYECFPYSCAGDESRLMEDVINAIGDQFYPECVTESSDSFNTLELDSSADKATGMLALVATSAAAALFPL